MQADLCKNRTQHRMKIFNQSHETLYSQYIQEIFSFTKRTHKSKTQVILRGASGTISGFRDAFLLHEKTRCHITFSQVLQHRFFLSVMADLLIFLMKRK